MSVERDARFQADLIDYAALAVIAVLAASVALGIEGPIRAVLALIFVTFIPGWAVLTNWNSAAKSSVLALSVLLSIAISTAVATTSLWLHLWNPLGIFSITASVSAIAILYGHRRRRSAAAHP